MQTEAMSSKVYKKNKNFTKQGKQKMLTRQPKTLLIKSKKHGGEKQAAL